MYIIYGGLDPPQSHGVLLSMRKNASSTRGIGVCLLVVREQTRLTVLDCLDSLYFCGLFAVIDLYCHGSMSVRRTGLGCRIRACS